MGEYADMYLDGTLDEETGELIDGDSPGHPRSPARDRREKKNKLKLPHACPECRKRFASEKAVADHMRAKHAK